MSKKGVEHMNAQKSFQTFREFHKRIGTRRSDRELEIRKQTALVKSLQDRASEEQARLTLMLIQDAA